MIVWLSSYPRSGNTFVRILLHRLYGIQTHSVYSVRNPKEHLLGDGGKLMALIGQEEYESDVAALSASHSWEFLKTHQLPANDDYPAITIIRDGRDALVSYAHFIIKTEYDTDFHRAPRLFEQTLEELILGRVPYALGGWSCNIREWTNRNTTTIIQYEILINDPVLSITRALGALGICLPAVGNAVPEFGDLHREVPWFFRKGKVGAWRGEMPWRLERLFQEVHGETAAAFGYMGS